MNHTIVKICIIYPDTSGPQFLVLRRSMQAKYFPGMGDLPGGKVDAGEDLIAAIKREVYEETGLILKNQIHEWLVHRFLFDGQMAQEHVFMSISHTKVVTVNAEEHDSFLWIPLEQLAKSTLHPKLKEILLAHMARLQAFFKIA